MSGIWESKLKSIWKSVRSRYYWLGLGHELVYDLFNTRELNWRRKIWAYRRGFLAYRITEYGLNDQNYHLYLPDFVYYRLHPINGRFHFWIDDKLTLKYVLHPFDAYLPRYYFHLDSEGQVTRLMDCPSHYGETLDDILTLLREKGLLAVKLTGGSRGQGFSRMAFQDGQYILNEEPLTAVAMEGFLARQERCVITEWLSPHPELSQIWNGATSSVRVLAYRNKDNKTGIAGAYIKFGTSLSGMVDNISAGGLSAVVDVTSGAFHDGRVFRENKMDPIQVHPDTGVPLAGTVPFWEEIKPLLSAVGEYLPHFKYMGYDIVISHDSFKLVEINSLPAIDILNCYHPLLADPDVAEFFNRLRQSG